MLFLQYLQHHTLGQGMMELNREDIQRKKDIRSYSLFTGSEQMKEKTPRDSQGVYMENVVKVVCVCVCVCCIDAGSNEMPQ